MAMGSLSVRARPQDADTGTEERGALTFVDNSVDVTTGTIKLKGTFPNRITSCGPASSYA